MSRQFLATVQPLRAIDPDVVLSSHLRPAAGSVGTFLDMPADAPAAEPIVRPDQEALTETLASFEPV